ncbi:MAG: MarR family transcriptional regulator [Deltaproteobacteria bacterium]|nr:MarR family transcriptional regulator [Deltaproteobacteria bacterium]
MTDPALRDLFGLELALLARWWRSKLDERLRPLGLSQARWTALWHLARGGDGLTQKQLARAVGVEGPSMVRVLDALERDGLVERRQPPQDRRVRALYLTSSGRAVLDSIDAQAGEMRASLLSGVTDADLATCMQVFQRIRKAEV